MCCCCLILPAPCSGLQLLPFAPQSQSSRNRIRIRNQQEQRTRWRTRMTAAMCRQDASTLLAKPQQEPEQQRCSCSADMCAMPARVMECVYPCHLLVFGVDKRAQLTRQSGAGAGAQMSAAWRGGAWSSSMHLSRLPGHGRACGCSSSFSSRSASYSECLLNNLPY